MALSEGAAVFLFFCRSASKNYTHIKYKDAKLADGRGAVLLCLSVVWFLFRGDLFNLLLLNAAMDQNVHPGISKAFQTAPETASTGFCKAWTL